MKVKKIPLSMTAKMKEDIEREAKRFGVSEQGFIRTCIVKCLEGKA